jgi:hypothetical protein
MSAADPADVGHLLLTAALNICVLVGQLGLAVRKPELVFLVVTYGAWLSCENLWEAAGELSFARLSALSTSALPGVPISCSRTLARALE